jgi:geranylgeranyl reductase family protein
VTARADVIVVGAGPAGAATAILLAERGRSVTVLDRARFPRPKLCGEYVSPEALRMLDRLGALKALDAAGAQRLAGMRITAPNGTVLRGRYRDVGRWRPYRGHALAVSREVLDGVLADRLRALPVDFREEVCVTDVIVEDGAVVGVRMRAAAAELRAPIVVAADGRASVIAHRLGCRAPHRLRRMALATYVSGVDDCRDHGEIFVDPPDYSILNPIAPDRVNLSLVVPLDDAAPWSGRLETFFTARLKQVPHLARRVAGARLEAPVRAMGPLAYRVFPPREGGVLLVGDAAGFYDPFTGEGIFSAFRGAELAAETVARALDGGDVSARALGGYARARRAVFADKAHVTRALQAIIGRRWLANLSARILETRPGLLDLLLGVVGDYVPPRALLGSLAAA